MLELKIFKSELMPGMGQGSGVWLFCFMLLLSLFAGCSGSPALSVTGVFVNSARSEFSSAEDTLVVSPMLDREYAVERRTGITMLAASGQAGKRVFERELWRTVCDERDEVLVEQKRGLRIRLVDSGLMLESAFYRRIRDLDGLDK